MENEFDDIFEEYEKEFENKEDRGKGGESEEEKGKEGGEEGEEPNRRQGEEEEWEDLDELSKMMGEKPKSAAIISGMDKISLCSMCTLCEIPADCFDGDKGKGSFGILNVSERDPEEDARTLTQTFKGLEVILALNRDQNLSATIYKEGKKKEKLAPPLALFNFSTLESFLVGSCDLRELKEEFPSLNSLSITKEEALELLKQIFRN